MKRCLLITGLIVLSLGCSKNTVVLDMDKTVPFNPETDMPTMMGGGRPSGGMGSDGKIVKGGRRNSPADSTR